MVSPLIKQHPEWFSRLDIKPGEPLPRGVIDEANFCRLATIAFLRRRSKTSDLGATDESGGPRYKPNEVRSAKSNATRAWANLVLRGILGGKDIPGRFDPNDWGVSRAFRARFSTHPNQDFRGRISTALYDHLAIDSLREIVCGYRACEEAFGRAEALRNFGIRGAAYATMEVYGDVLDAIYDMEVPMIAGDMALGVDVEPAYQSD